MNTDIKAHCVRNLNQLDALLGSMDSISYSKACDLLSGGTIGQHMRHVLEFYICLLGLSAKGEVNYDLRNRDLLLEQELDYARQTITQIIDQLNKQGPNIPDALSVVAGFNVDSEFEQIKLRSSFEREFAYCLEHSIHHQALIKVALLSSGLSHILDAQFGIAPSTLRFLSKSS